jgi:hypothetical protein
LNAALLIFQEHLGVFRSTALTTVNNGTGVKKPKGRQAGTRDMGEPYKHEFWKEYSIRADIFANQSSSSIPAERVHKTDSYSHREANERNRIPLRGREGNHSPLGTTKVCM